MVQIFLMPIIKCISIHICQTTSVVPTQNSFNSFLFLVSSLPKHPVLLLVVWPHFKVFSSKHSPHQSRMHTTRNLFLCVLLYCHSNKRPIPLCIAQLSSLQKDDFITITIIIIMINVADHRCSMQLHCLTRFFCAWLGFACWCGRLYVYIVYVYFAG